MGIFAERVNIFTTYQARIRFRDKVMGGTPKDPKIIMGWIKTRMGIDELEELRRQTILTMTENGLDALGEDMTLEKIESMTLDEIIKAGEKFAASRQTNGFKIDPDIGLYLEGRTVKAMVKECVNILYAGERWLKSQIPVGKGPKSAVAERVFVDPDKIALGVREPSGVDLFIGHTNGPKGPQSNLTYYEYVTGAVLDFEVKILRDFMTIDQWAELWTQAEDNGLGALRSQGFGRFDIEAWEPVRKAKRKDAAA